ncbi:hypothetical protein DES40_2158 [Litorimonas taeanensis]|uniref:Uncharacterized protein n=1 Tax=Litorimonas taeanensis TaxID=568099 RepID=A0A420WEE8_9PROT|nr:hypothetical protein DES40_2158 [Litorimonas taeanensis]
MGYRSVARDASADYRYRKENNTVPAGLSEAGYIAAFRRFHNPRGPLYVALTLAAILLLTPVAMLIIQFLLEQLYQVTGRSRVFEPGYLVWGFSIFFMMIASWALIAYLGARRFYRRAPGTFAQELEKEIEKEDKI